MVNDARQTPPFEVQQEYEAAREAAAIGGRVSYHNLEPSQRPLIEAGEGVSEGYELAEEDLIEAAEDAEGDHGPFAYAFPAESER